MENEFSTEDSLISFMPYAHVMEQIFFYISLACGCRVGYYQGNPMKIVEDC